ncbi:hypothetical protein GGR28_002477 [Lewinella aquimaris]|uniref:Outer membrane protein beta-barrel domain-containing protein n=1 Tax=Neolewinella aquimaris TaxID=1835722 RepID=A0A840E451_9BACT|nr:outer membrane beta-barrel protein [Neolewinella aquimaris]MBB4079850.1 hypothetical protein [Neolewinella aquimaris]
MLRWLPVLFVALSLAASAQTLERSIGLELSPQLSESRISGTNSATFTQLDRLDSLEQGGVGFGIGILYESRVDRIGFSTGLRYTRAGYATLEQPAPGSATTFSDDVSANYLALPFDVNFYQDVTDNDRVLFVLGVALQYHLGTKIRRTTYANGAETGTETLADDAVDYRPFVTSFLTGIGYDRKLSTDWAIRFQPTFQFFLNGNLRPDADTIANRNYYQLGLRIVVRRLFI